MSRAPLSLSADLLRLRDEGYDLDIRSGYLLMRVPYVTSQREVAVGTLVSKLSLSGDVTNQPDDHVMYFSGEYPCNSDGSPIASISHASSDQLLAEGLTTNHSFSAKPDAGQYRDYYEKMSTYAAILSDPAAAIDTAATPRTFPVIEATEEESIFHYIDTATSRAEIGAVNQKLDGQRIGIVGLGGTGSYVLDLVAKTPVAEIHLFDGDRFLQHNAFRSPGAPSADELRTKQSKVAFFGSAYSKMRRGVVVHEEFLEARNVEQLRELDFVFLCLDRGTAKRIITEKLEEWGTTFIDVGMGVELVDDTLIGLLRVTTSTAAQRSHIPARISFADDEQDDEYDHNIQIAELNALNAALAVIKWKKLRGFYLDQMHEHNSTYVIAGNELINDEY